MLDHDILDGVLMHMRHKNGPGTLSMGTASPAALAATIIESYFVYIAR